ncbi:MAG: hypothetical protein LBT82_02560 [Oscillospiraceae bacterium]|jgi:hypothetical protein|nr:hypothetical protein [Oscillospiraceae bacterium]
MLKKQKKLKYSIKATVAIFLSIFTLTIGSGCSLNKSQPTLKTKNENSKISKKEKTHNKLTKNATTNLPPKAAVLFDEDPTPSSGDILEANVTGDTDYIIIAEKRIDKNKYYLILRTECLEGEVGWPGTYKYNGSPVKNHLDWWFSNLDEDLALKRYAVGNDADINMGFPFANTLFNLIKKNNDNSSDRLENADILKKDDLYLNMLNKVKKTCRESVGTGLSNPIPGRKKSAFILSTQEASNFISEYYPVKTATQNSGTPPKTIINWSLTKNPKPNNNATNTNEDNLKQLNDIIKEKKEDEKSWWLRSGNYIISEDITEGIGNQYFKGAFLTSNFAGKIAKFEEEMVFPDEAYSTLTTCEILSEEPRESTKISEFFERKVSSVIYFWIDPKDFTKEKMIDQYLIRTTKYNNYNEAFKALEANSDTNEKEKLEKNVEIAKKAYDEIFSNYKITNSLHIRPALWVSADIVDEANDDEKEDDEEDEDDQS